MLTGQAESFGVQACGMVAVHLEANAGLNCLRLLPSFLVRPKARTGESASGRSVRNL